MKLLIAADIFPPDIGGPATYTVTLANALTLRGVDVRIVSLNPQSDRSQVSCVVYHVSWRNKLLRYLQYFFFLIREARRADMVYAMGPVNAGLPALIAARLAGKKFAVKVVGDYAWEQGKQRFGVEALIDAFQQDTKVAWQVRLLRFVQTCVARHADVVIVPSLYLKRIVERWGTAARRVIVIYNAVATVSVDPMPKPSHEFWVVSIGRLVSWKGMAALIRACASISLTHPNLRLKIIGSGPESSALSTLIGDLHVGAVVELVGGVARETAFRYLSTADVFVLNSAYEGLSHVIIEALRYGKPVLASQVGGNPELIAPGKTGELFVYNDVDDIKKKIESVLQSTLPRESHQLTDRRFELETMARETMTVISTLCKKS